MLTDRGVVSVAVLSLLLVVTLPGCGGSGDNPQAPAASNPPPAGTDPAVPGKTADAGAPADEPEQAGDATPEFRPETASGAVPGIPAPTNTAPIVAVANYFTELPGLDIAALKPKQKEKFLQHVNSEICPCGCKNDTLARCYVNDPRCPVVRDMVQKVYDEVKAGK